MREKEKIGVVGLGKMGNPLARRLIGAGYSITVYDLVAEQAKSLADKGAAITESAKDLSAGVDVIITMIPDDLALEAAIMGKSGVLEGAKRGAILIDMSTVSPQASSKVAEAAKGKGVNFLRATVSGSPKYVEEGILTIFISGPEDIYKRCSAILATLGQKVFYIGPAEEARYLKLLINMIAGTTAMIVAEALAFGERGGVDWNRMLDAIGGSVVASPIVCYKIQPLKERNVTPTFTISQMIKDFDLALSTGRVHGVPMPVTSTVMQFMRIMKATGKGEMDLWGLVTLMEELAGIKK